MLGKPERVSRTATGRDTLRPGGKMRYVFCDDCGEPSRRPVQLPDGRALCRPCAHELSALRQAIHHQTVERMRERRERMTA